MTKETNILAVVGAFARIEPGESKSVRQRLDQIAGVETFDLDDRDRVGILIETKDAAEAEQILEGPIRATPGVWGAWPVSVELEDDPDRIAEA